MRLPALARRRGLGTYLFAATVAVVLLSVGLMLGIGLLLTHRAVERATLKDVGHQADLLAARERESVLPGAHLVQLRPLFRRQHETAAIVPFAKPSKFLSRATARRVKARHPVDGTIRIDGTDYFFAARRASTTQAYVLLRPKRLGSTAFRPFFLGLLLSALIGASLAAIVSYLLARRIARPVGRVVAAARRIGEEQTPDPVPVEGAAELATLARSFNEMAQQLARARAAEKQFLLSVSHELKTPLTAIRGYGEGFEDGAFSAEETIATVLREASRLERLVQDLLELARMNRTDFSIHHEPIDLGGVAHEVVNRHEAQARGFGVTLEASAPLEAPAIGDYERAVQVASNLVENALRLTPRGGVVRVVAEPATLTVEDSGPGLKPEEIPRAFERFYLYSRYGADRPVGTGLGLSIVKELSEGMGGTVEVESELDRGTRFTLRLQLPPARERPARPAAAARV